MKEGLSYNTYQKHVYLRLTYSGKNSELCYMDNGTYALISFMYETFSFITKDKAKEICESLDRKAQWEMHLRMLERDYDSTIVTNIRDINFLLRYLRANINNNTKWPLGEIYCENEKFYLKKGDKTIEIEEKDIRSLFKILHEH